MKKILSIVTSVLCVIAIGLSIAALSVGISAKKQKEVSDVQYVLYLGTNHKDTNEPVFSHDEAKEKLKEILLEHFGGYTIQEANGGWKDGETVYEEYTLVVYLSDTSLENVHKAADQMIEVFHQSSVLIQSNQTSTEFYSGN